jgi:hypothetical protein
VAVIVWWLDLQLPMQSVPVTTDVVSSNLVRDEVYNIRDEPLNFQGGGPFFLKKYSDSQCC